MSDKPKFDNSGILFFQDDKGADNKPDWKGNITVKGEELELAGWIKPGKRGNFITLKVSEKRRQDVSGTVPAAQGRSNTPNAPRTQYVGTTRPSATDARVNQRIDSDDFDDSVPF